ncbi:hypothetical protein EDC01DRAFT_717972 [Geopyxis carbonaria]|nr:hypothetical protein EDC01DRAFT_717972 [Geopyxis carbonaria]
MDTSHALQRRVDLVECWDDDPDFADIDQLQRQSTISSQYTLGNTDHHRRESVCSSRMSVASAYDLDSSETGNHEHQVTLDDSPAKAIASAIHAGIPIPQNVPSSALVGGTIKRLGTNKRVRKVSAHDDWSEDLELPALGNALSMTKKEFPESLAQIFEGKQSISPVRSNPAAVPSARSQLNKFRDIPDDDDDFFGDGDDVPTLKVSPARKFRQAAPLMLTPPLLESATKGTPSVDDDFEHDFEFPADAPLQLNLTKGGERPRPPAVHGIDSGFDDWGDTDSGLGSSYYGSGPRRERGERGSAMSIRSPSISAIRSPSLSGMTVESEDDTPLDGLVLPAGVLPDFQQLLKRRQQAAVMDPVQVDRGFHVQKNLDDPANEEFFDGLEIGDGEIFDKNKLTLNRNVKQKLPPRKPSPVRRTAMSLTFTTNKPAPPPSSSRTNRLSQGHPTLLPPLQLLEPVAERENQRSPKRNNRNLKSENVHPKPTTTTAQLLRSKRSMPNMAKSTSSQSKAPRPPSRTSNGRPSSRNSAGRPPSSSNSAGRPTSSGSRPPSSGGRPQSRSSVGRPSSRNESQTTRPKTPHGNINSFRHPAPFVPGGASVHSSHHISAKVSRHNIKRDERPETDRRPMSRVQQRTPPRHSPSSSGASNTTAKRCPNTTPRVAPENLRREAASIGQLTQPTRKRNFGDGTELEAFDDLPTSSRAENRYTVTPVARGAPKTATRQKSSAKRENDTESPKKKLDRTNRSPNDANVPRFARDTAASRNAREYTQQRLGMTTPVPTSPNAERWRAQIAARSSITPRNSRKRSSQQSKPHLIKPMGNINQIPKESATNGMTYNPRTMRWDGNERDLQAFDHPAETRTPPRQPALITKVNQSGGKAGIQVVGGMVFDPSRMCWLKVDEDPEDEFDPFEGVDDLPDDMMSIDDQSITGRPGTNNSIVMGDASTFGGGGGGAGRLNGAGGEFVVGEEFDVGPMFVGKQREEEERWRKRVEGWISIEVASKRENRFALKEILAEHHR